MPEHTPAPTPARSLYGFFMYLFSKTILIVYCLWAIVPDQYLNYINIYYFPIKYWSTAIPIQCLVALTLFAFLVYPSANLMLTCTRDSKSTICDKFSADLVPVNRASDCNVPVCICADEQSCMKDRYSPMPEELLQNTVPQLHDLDIRYVSKKLYFDKNKTMI
ncbi:phosphatidylinositol N-acetylglucosaminyltransferase subunit P [Leptidea sinapis]|uniref:phosphatidylinositol N-acetylglucosaminyltransferase subunit P n=1 Tax=Leptidea sinapis TaxID=189913 RepID=UPI00212CB1A7|nr:phosphatidylinositol N-acetylglucosaminyltransferase subunit P [Leptidea sinapis]XP_050667134.1 phosphatidylinositol N-acetylglucosaminyltransferase subunit P [Leptidea sinapis]XP_050667135.1 phosphatidylinositol N-acetylglucosaminyltransferase subunit P [Leptidea sinapis]XP_050667136.1 phosphatidylinositol N-acetylglucosaminyltransferase subunit P [Leptidea sinapis]